jgi:hypothetical protein
MFVRSRGNDKATPETGEHSQARSEKSPAAPPAPARPIETATMQKAPEESSPEESSPEPPAGELEAVLSSALAAVAEIRSGEIIYKKTMTASSRNFLDAGIEERLDDFADELRRKGMAESEMAPALDIHRKAMEDEIARSVSTFNYDGEYIFSDGNYYHTFSAPNLPAKRGKRFQFGEKMTTIFTFSEGIRAKIVNERTDHLAEFRSPIDAVISLLVPLSEGGWEISGTSRSDDGATYTIRNSGGWDSHIIDINPDANFPIASYEIAHGNGSHTSVRLGDIKWDAGAGVYYPAEIVEEKSAHMAYGRHAYRLVDVVLNGDIGDEVFRARFEEGTSVSDNRFEPPVEFIFRHADYGYEYLDELDEKAEALQK